MCQRLYNAALEERIGAYKVAGKQVSFFDQSRQLTQVRADDHLYRLVSIKLMRGVLQRLDKAYRRFFRHGGFPRFKSRGRYRTLEINDGCSSMLKGHDLRIKGLPRTSIKTSRELPDVSRLKSIRVVRKPIRVEVQLVYELDDVPISRASSNRPVGIDVGISNRLMLSDGTAIAKRVVDASRMRVLQRSVARKRKGGVNRRKVVLSLAKEHQRRTERNRGYLHELTAWLAKQYDGFAIEDLNVKGMVKHPTLAKSIQDQTWAMFTQLLAEKAESAGLSMVKVDPKGTSQICSACGVIVKKSLSVRTHGCACGLVIDRDLNAAINIRDRGFLVHAGGRLPVPSSSRGLPLLGGKQHALGV